MPLLTQLRQALLQLLGAQRVLQHHRHEQLGRKKRQSGELQVDRAIGDGVAQLHAAVGGEAHNVARIGFVDGLAALAHEGHHAGRAQLFGGALHLQLHARRVLAGGHAHKGDAVAVVRVHIRLHLEHHTRKSGVLGAYFGHHRLLVDHQRTGAVLRLGRLIYQRVQHLHHTKIIHARAKENRGLLARQKRGMVPGGRRAGGQLHAVMRGFKLMPEALQQRCFVG